RAMAGAIRRGYPIAIIQCVPQVSPSQPREYSLVVHGILKARFGPKVTLGYEIDSLKHTLPSRIALLTAFAAGYGRTCRAC
ncbi:MAG: hypothetical protein ACXWKG_03435, partial [Limisphaerales bacterium]